MADEDKQTIFLIPKNYSKQIEIVDGLIIGRKDFPAEKSISREHCKFTILDETIFVEDLSSLNKTRINDNVLEDDKKYELRQGDKFEMGRLICLIETEENATKNLEFSLKEMPVNREVLEELSEEELDEIDSEEFKTEVVSGTELGKLQGEDNTTSRITHENRRTVIEFDQLTSNDLEVNKRRRRKK